MQVPQIRMHSQFAQIGITTTPARQTIHQQDADLRIEQPLANMKMRTTEGRLTIDQTEAWEDMNLKSIFKTVRENAQKGHQAVMEGMAQAAAEGQEMINIQSGRNAFVEQAKRDTFKPPAEVNITWIPKPFSVKVHYQPGKTDIQFQERKPIIDARVNKPVISYAPGDVNVHLKQRNSLRIDLVK